LAPNELKNKFRPFENVFKYLKGKYFEFWKIEKYLKNMKIYGKLLQGIITCFKHFLHLETLYNDMNPTTKAFIGLTPTYNKITLYCFNKGKRKAKKGNINT
jgi:hypothetical protein